MAFWQRLGVSLRSPSPASPPITAILIASAHYSDPSPGRPSFTSSARPGVEYDFGMPMRKLYTLRYDCPGSPGLAARAAGLLRSAGLSPELDASRGLDHGAWVPLLRMLPAADVPVVQVSIRPRGSPAYHLALGAALAPLAREGVLILGSGAATHDLRGMVWGDFDRPVSEAEAEARAPAGPYAGFEAWLVGALEKGEVGEVLEWAAKAPHAARRAARRLAPSLVLPSNLLFYFGLRLCPCLAFFAPRLSGRPGFGRARRVGGRPHAPPPTPAF